MIFVRAIMGIGVIIFGFIIYPAYKDNVIAPLVDIANALFPNMNILESTYLNILPLVIFLMILFFGIMVMLGKAGIGRSNEP